MSIIAIDFETATSARDSACEIGVTLIDGRRIVESRSWLIRPPCWPNFEPFNVRIHGISPKMVADQPTFGQLWSDLAPWFEGRTVIAHNAAFDIGVLRDMLKVYSIPIPENPYLCTYRMARRVWPDLGKYGLKTMIRHLSLELGRHHRAEYDSVACAGVLLKAMDRYEVDDLPSLLQKTGSAVGKITQFGHDLTSTGRNEIPVGDPSLRRPGHPLYRKTVVFTGTLDTMSRSQAWKRVVDIGGSIAEQVSEDTHVLVVGQNDSVKRNGAGNGNAANGVTGKYRQALRLQERGVPILVWNEQEFMNQLG